MRRYPGPCILLFPLVALAACGGEPPPPPLPPSRPPAAPARPPPVATAADPLGPRPEVPPAPPFAPPTPKVFAGPNGTTIWLLERHTLPYVALSVAIPSGSAADPPGKGGLAEATANMLDEGAGTRGALQLSSAIETLGATLSTFASSDSSSVGLSVLKKNFAAAMAILGDVVGRPRFDAVEWKRVHDLWVNDLKERASDPVEVSRVVARAALYGFDHPYGHPLDGTLASAQKVSLDDVRQFYKVAWRPDRAVIVVAGDVTKDELTPILESTLGGWKAPATPPPVPVAPPAPQGPRPHVVLVDRPEAPQSVIDIVRMGVAAADPDAAPLWRANAAIGGSFTSRLNQDLREEHGWSYGAFSRVSASRGVGQILMGAAVFTDKTPDALKAMLADVDAFAKNGLTDDEVDKTRSLARAELVEAYEGVASAASRLASDAVLGLPADYEATASLRRDAADKAALNQLAARYFDVAAGVIVVVGPRAKIESALTDLGPVELRDPDGKVLPPKR